MTKILITGMNKNQCVKDFYLRQQLKVIPSHYSLIRCLEGMGHKVEQRQVGFDDDLSSYGKIIVFLAGPRQLVAVKFYEGLMAIHKARKDQLILAFDDWQTKGIFDSIGVCTDPSKLFAKFVLGVNGYDEDNTEIRKYEPQFMSAINKITDKETPVLLSAFSGGDPSLLIDYPTNLIYTYNPDPYHHNRTPGDRGDVPLIDMSPMEVGLSNTKEDDFVRPEDKELKFNFASLVQSKTKKWLKNQKITQWEIEYFGSKKDGQRRLGEGDMVQVFAEQWGCLMPGYDHAGSGWWRARPRQVANAGSILIGDPKEMIVYYHNDEIAGLRATDLEGLNTRQLSLIAQDQARLLDMYHPLDKPFQARELWNALEQSTK